MSDPILSVNNVSKVYQRHKNNWVRLATWLHIRKAKAGEGQAFWANRDISFHVQPGEAVAVIGQNGAGKSTLLKMITGTVRPSSGNISVRGKVSSLLELGIGFNPELTGRQNIFMAGGLMGLSQARLQELAPRMEAFAEIGEFFDAPLRVYSSGMQARLAFALATCERPDVLIVDEILSVGDSYFQHKSFDRIRQFKAEGSSIILVTHGLADVRTLCDRVILLDKGTVLKDGAPDEVVDFYNALIAAKENEVLNVEQRRAKDGWLVTKSGSGKARIRKLELLDAISNLPMSAVLVNQKLNLIASVEIVRDIPALVLGYMLKDRAGHLVWGSNTWHTRQKTEALKAGSLVTFSMQFTCTLGPGSYSFSPALVSSDTHLVDNYEWTDNALVFDVINGDLPFFVGTNFLNADFNIRKQPRAELK